MDTWIILQKADVYASINNAELQAALVTQANTQPTDVLASIMADVTSEVRGYCGVRNTLGADGSVPAELKNAAVDLIIYRVANRLKKKSLAEDKKPDAEAAQKKFEAVAEGKIALSAPVAPSSVEISSPSPSMTTPHRQFGRWQEEGL